MRALKATEAASGASGGQGADRALTGQGDRGGGSEEPRGQGRQLGPSPVLAPLRPQVVGQVGGAWGEPRPRTGGREGLVINRTTPARSNQGTALLRATPVTARRTRTGLAATLPDSPGLRAQPLVLTNSERAHRRSPGCSGLPATGRPEALQTSRHHSAAPSEDRVFQARGAFTVLPCTSGRHLFGFCGSTSHALGSHGCGRARLKGRTGTGTTLSPSRVRHLCGRSRDLSLTAEGPRCSPCSERLPRLWGH